MADIDVDWESENEPAVAPRKRRRLRFYLPGGYAVHRLIMMSIGGAALFGAILGDIWLWRLLYG